MKYLAGPTLGMDVDDDHSLRLLEGKSDESLLEQVISLKNQVIGNKRQKIDLINQGVVDKLLNILNSSNQPQRIRLESVIVLGSLAKGDGRNVNVILASGALPTLISGLVDSSDEKYSELCLSCLRSLVQADACPKDFLYESPSIVPTLLSLRSLSTNAFTCVAVILESCCLREEHQNYLHSNNTIELMLPALSTGYIKLEAAVLKFYCQMARHNLIVSTQMMTASDKDVSLKEIVIRQLSRDKPLKNRLLAAKCLAYLYRANAIPATDECLVLKVLPTLVACCKAGNTTEDRVEGAEIIAYLTELDVYLQQQASITDQCLLVLSSYFKHDSKSSPSSSSHSQQSLSLQQAGLMAFSSLAANAEDIRKKVIERDNIMGHINDGLTSTSLPLQLAAARCIHSLSRSVQQLRTHFQEHNSWKLLMQILSRGENEELINVASSTLCNLLLEFSPCKEIVAPGSVSGNLRKMLPGTQHEAKICNSMVELGAVELLVRLTHASVIPLRLNAIWALMNVAFQANLELKVDILGKLGTEQLFCLLRDQSCHIVMKTLGLVRNLLSCEQHIDVIMHQSGEMVIQAVVMILEGDHTAEIKEQALCILQNVAGGETSKRFIMDNDDILKKILDYMQHSQVRIQMAALLCMDNLADKGEKGDFTYQERHRKLRSVGAFRILQQIKTNGDLSLRDRAAAVESHFL